jgi:threonine/homoserine/homoserine lactone efflux protein
MIGPVFFLLLETSIRKGVRAALSFDAGVLISDLVFVLVAYVFYSEVASITEGKHKATLQLIGGILFLIYGVVNLLKKSKAIEVDEEGNTITTPTNYILHFWKGLVVNFLNPAVIFYWFSVMTLAGEQSQNVDGKSMPVLLFIGITLTTCFSLDILKILGAKQLRPLMTDNLLKAFNQLIGIIFIGFGVFLIIQGVHK